MTDAQPTEIVIDRLGAQGDGIADAPGGPVFVPFALPQERWRVSEGGPSERLSDASQRVVPPCRHFGVCGGCVAQHMSDDLYNAWKHDTVVKAFAHRGIDATVAPLRRIATASRRRAYFGLARVADGIQLGFREEGQHRLVDLEDCVILDPMITGALPALRQLAEDIMPRGAAATGARLQVTRLDHGLDVSFELKRTLPADILQRVAKIAMSAGIVRLSIANEVVMSAAAPLLTLGPASLQPPAGVFLQAVPEAEQVMTELMLAAVAKAKTVADLFCGLGTFTYALAKRARVTAIDGDKRAIAALTSAAKGTAGIKPVTAKTRDLFREPMSARELDAFDAVVLDPPRAGAEAQAQRLAASKVSRVVMVSCNPATLARDARLLIDGGYALGSVTPIDQFVYSPHIEAVAIFNR